MYNNKKKCSDLGHFFTLKLLKTQGEQITNSYFCSEMMYFRRHRVWVWSSLFKHYGNFAEKSEFFILDKVVKLVGGGSVINGAYPVQLGYNRKFKGEMGLNINSAASRFCIRSVFTDADGSVIVLYGSVNTEHIQNRLAALHKK